MAAVTICIDFGAQENSLSLFPLFPHLFITKWWDQMPWSSFSECWALSQLFHSLLSLTSRGFLVLLCFLPWVWCHLCRSEVIDIFPGNPDSSLCFIHPSILHDVFCIVQETGIKTILMEKKHKKAKWLSGEALQIAVKRREVKSKGEKERYKHLNAEFQRIARRDKKAFFSDQC